MRWYQGMVVLTVALAAAAGAQEMPKSCGGAGYPSQEGKYTLPAPEEYRRLGEKKYLKELAAGRQVDEEEAAWLVRNGRFENWVEEYPAIAGEIARHPYAAYTFSNSGFFEAWRKRHPAAAEPVAAGARQWQGMSVEAKTEYFKCNPTLPSEGMIWPEKEGRPRQPAPGTGTTHSPRLEDEVAPYDRRVH